MFIANVCLLSRKLCRESVRPLHFVTISKQIFRFCLSSTQMHKTTKSTAVKEADVSGQLIENVNNGLTLTHADARLHSKLKHIKASRFRKGRI